MTVLSPAAGPAAGPATRPRPLRSLALAEYRQFVRNKALIYTGVVTPVAAPLAVWFAARRESPANGVAAAFEAFACASLLFLQFYSVLSMVTTRRGEGVLKRLRTGEAPDWKILAAPALPGLLLTLVGMIAVPVVVYASGAPAPENPLVLLLALPAGLLLFTLLALATSGVTKNAEAAQITSLPVMAVAIAGLASLRAALPDGIAAVAGWTPLAAVSDLISLGTIGRLPAAGEAGSLLGSAGLLGDLGRPVVTLVLWTVLALLLTRRYFRWDDRG